MTERQLVNCARCGAPVSEFDLGQPHLHCTNCGAEIAVPKSVEARAVAYNDEMHREEQRAERAALVEISTRESTTTVKKTRYGVWLIGYLAGLPVLATLYGFFAPPLDAPNQLFAQQVAAGVFFGLAILPIVLFIVLTLLPGRRAARAAAKRERLQLGTPCQGCGALVTFEPGAVSVTCTYCGVANVAPSQVAKPMIHWASDNASAAEKELAQSAREEERATEEAAVRAKNLESFWRAIGPFLLPSGFPLVLGLSFYGRGSRSDDRGAIFFILVGVFGFIVVGTYKLLCHKRR